MLHQRKLHALLGFVFLLCGSLESQAEDVTYRYLDLSEFSVGSINLIDVDHDGDLDFAYTQRGSELLWAENPGREIILNEGLGIELPRSEILAGRDGSIMLKGDFNRDGFDDLLLSLEKPGETPSHERVIALTSADAPHFIEVKVDLPFSDFSLVDLNDDDIPDFVDGANPTGIIYRPGTSTAPFFGAPVELTYETIGLVPFDEIGRRGFVIPPNSESFLTEGFYDFNGDGVFDQLITRSRILGFISYSNDLVALNTGTNMSPRFEVIFDPTFPTLTSNRIRSVVDWDGDGDLDITFLGQDRVGRFFEFDGSDFVERSVSDATASEHEGNLDLNSDSVPDLIFSEGVAQFMPPLETIGFFPVFPTNRRTLSINIGETVSKKEVQLPPLTPADSGRVFGDDENVTIYPAFGFDYYNQDLPDVINGDAILVMELLPEDERQGHLIPDATTVTPNSVRLEFADPLPARLLESPFLAINQQFSPESLTIHFATKIVQYNPRSLLLHFPEDTFKEGTDLSLTAPDFRVEPRGLASTVSIPSVTIEEPKVDLAYLDASNDIWISSWNGTEFETPEFSRSAFDVQPGDGAFETTYEFVDARAVSDRDLNRDDSCDSDVVYDYLALSWLRRGFTVPAQITTEYVPPSDCLVPEFFDSSVLEHAVDLFKSEIEPAFGVIPDESDLMYNELGVFVKGLDSVYGASSRNLSLRYILAADSVGLNDWIGFGNLDGDGDFDTVVVDTDGGRVGVLLGKDLVELEPRFWTENGFRSNDLAGSEIFLEDVTGDQLDDLICITDRGYAWVAQMTISGFDSPRLWAETGFIDSSVINWKILWADLDNDLDQDIVQINEFGEVWVSFSRVDHFTVPEMVGDLGFKHDLENGEAVFIGNFKD